MTDGEGVERYSRGREQNEQRYSKHEAMTGRWPGLEPGPGCMVPRLLLAPKAPHIPVHAGYPMYPPFSKNFNLVLDFLL